MTPEQKMLLEQIAAALSTNSSIGTYDYVILHTIFWAMPTPIGNPKFIKRVLHTTTTWQFLAAWALSLSVFPGV